jgi:hypothetical protein
MPPHRQAVTVRAQCHAQGKIPSQLPLLPVFFCRRLCALTIGFTFKVIGNYFCACHLRLTPGFTKLTDNFKRSPTFPHLIRKPFGTCSLRCSMRVNFVNPIVVCHWLDNSVKINEDVYHLLHILNRCFYVL